VSQLIVTVYFCSAQRHSANYNSAKFDNAECHFPEDHFVQRHSVNYESAKFDFAVCYFGERHFDEWHSADYHSTVGILPSVVH
jgi:hypothetical protein